MSNNFTLFNSNQIPLFPAYIKPKPDELFSSWLVRMAHAHYMKVHTFTRLQFPNQHFWNRDIDRLIPDDILENLAIKSNMKYEQLFNTSLRSFKGSLLKEFTNNTCIKWILPLGIYHRIWLNKGLVYCPNCLKNDKDTPYFRKHWRLALTVICVKCEIQLCDCCPSCKSPIIFFRADLGKKNEEVGQSINTCYNCRTLLYKTKILKCSNHVVLMQKGLNTILENRTTNQQYLSTEYFDVLHQLIHLICNASKAGQKLRPFLELKLKLEFGIYRGGFKNRFEVLPIKERIKILYGATWLLDSWPYRLIQVCKNLTIYSSPLTKDMTDIPNWYAKIIRTHLYNNIIGVAKN